MASDLVNSLFIASAGMGAQSERLKIIAQNIANADNVPQYPEDQPYRRKVISFRNVMDEQLGVPTVQVYKIGTDKAPYRLKYDPFHPAANVQGYVQLPNVNTTVEMADMREAQRTYEANVKTVEITKSMIQNTLSLLR